MNHALTTPTDLKKFIREVPDFPKPGILFYDITTLLKEASALRFTIDTLAQRYQGHALDGIVSVEARGFIFGALLAYALNVGFIPIRKPKKLPADKLSITYDLEYGQETMEVHKDALQPGQRVLVVDDVLATGGTSAAAADVINSLGGDIVGFCFVLELTALEGRQKLAGYDVYSLLQY